MLEVDARSEQAFALTVQAKYTALQLIAICVMLDMWCRSPCTSAPPKAGVWDVGRLPKWSNMAAPAIAIKYWKLPNNATMRDVLLNVRADEACHSHVNHKFAELGPDDDNPFGTGSHMVA